MGFMWKWLLPQPIFEHLYYFLISSLTEQLVTKADINPGYKTNHSIPFVEINFEDATRGPGFWKFNTSLLLDKVFLQGASVITDIELDQQYHQRFNLWIKYKIYLAAN